MNPRETVSAAVLTAPGTLTLSEFERPRIGPDEALVRIEACGICGSDIDLLAGRPGSPLPLIPGHEPVGVIEEIGDEAARRRNLAPGDRVAVDPFIPCGACGRCVLGEFELCTANRHNYGSTPLSVTPSLWGGWATHLFVGSRSVLHRVPRDVPGDLAVLYNPLGAGIRWAVDLAGARIGSNILVLGAGQRGLSCAAAAKLAGAALVVVTGLARDRHKLDLALDLGADVAIDIEADDLHGAVNDLTVGGGVDAVVDTTPHATQPVLDALSLVGRGGTVVLAGAKRRPTSIPTDELIAKAVTVHGALGVGADAYHRAIELIASRRLPLERMRTHAFPLDRAAEAVATLAENAPSDGVVNIALTP